jgi:hypothetical protein
MSKSLCFIGGDGYREAAIASLLGANRVFIINPAPNGHDALAVKRWRKLSEIMGFMLIHCASVSHINNARVFNERIHFILSNSEYYCSRSLVDNVMPGDEIFTIAIDYQLGCSW